MHSTNQNTYPADEHRAQKAIETDNINELEMLFAKGVRKTPELLAAAVKRGNKDVVDMVATCENCQTEKGFRVIRELVRERNRTLLDVLRKKSQGVTPQALCQAIDRGDVPFVALHINSENFNQPINFSQTALEYVLERGPANYEALALILLDVSGPRNIKTALTSALCRGNSDVVKRLVVQGNWDGEPDDVSRIFQDVPRDRLQCDACIAALLHRSRFKALGLLVDARDQARVDLAKNAVESGKLCDLPSILKGAEDIRKASQNILNSMALGILEIDEEHAEDVIEILLEHGAQVTTDVLQIAMACIYFLIWRQLYARANELVDHEVLLEDAARKKLFIVKSLKEKGTVATHQALKHAIQSDDIDIVALLVNAENYNTVIKDNAGNSMTLLELHVSCGCPAITRHLLRLGAKVTKKALQLARHRCRSMQYEKTFFAGQHEWLLDIVWNNLVEGDDDKLVYTLLLNAAGRSAQLTPSLLHNLVLIPSSPEEYAAKHDVLVGIMDATGSSYNSALKPILSTYYEEVHAQDLLQPLEIRRVLILAVFCKPKSFLAEQCMRLCSASCGLHGWKRPSPAVVDDEDEDNETQTRSAVVGDEIKDENKSIQLTPRLIGHILGSDQDIAIACCALAFMEARQLDELPETAMLSKVIERTAQDKDRVRETVHMLYNALIQSESFAHTVATYVHRYFTTYAGQRLLWDMIQYLQPTGDLKKVIGALSGCFKAPQIRERLGFLFHAAFLTTLLEQSDATICLKEHFTEWLLEEYIPWYYEMNQGVRPTYETIQAECDKLLSDVIVRVSIANEQPDKEHIKLVALQEAKRVCLSELSKEQVALK